MKRLQDAQLAGGEGSFRTAAIERLEDANHTAYVKMRELGKAYQDENPTVILIDEIDKADIDFPNDLLRELDRGEFLIEEREVEREIRAKHPPFVIITSNDEKDLPEAFLRRCIFFQIKFPDGKSLEKIVQAHFPEASQGLIGLAVDKFCGLREQMKNSKGKKVSTSELIDWFYVLSSFPEDVAKSKLSASQVVFPEVLLKRLKDYDLISEEP